MIEVDQVSIVGASVCCRESCLHNCGIGDTIFHHQVRKDIANFVMWSRVPPEYWAHLQVIDSPLREHTQWDTYYSFQTEVVGQDALELGLREDESIDHWYRK